MMLRRPAGSALLLLMLVTSAAHGAALQSWDKKIESPGRFKVLRAFGDAAVLDKETGLVWEKTGALVGDFRNSMRHCAFRNVGGRLGWRLPALEELLTLVDPSNTTPALPDGAPFENVIGVPFWTANEEESDPTLAVSVSLDVFGVFSNPKSTTRKVLCVRGGRGSTTGRRGGF